MIGKELLDKVNSLSKRHEEEHLYLYVLPAEICFDLAYIFESLYDSHKTLWIHKRVRKIQNSVPTYVWRGIDELIKMIIYTPDGEEKDLIRTSLSKHFSSVTQNGLLLKTPYFGVSPRTIEPVRNPSSKINRPLRDRPAPDSQQEEGETE